MKVKSESEVAQSCPTLSLPGLFRAVLFPESYQASLGLFYFLNPFVKFLVSSLFCCFGTNQGYNLWVVEPLGFPIHGHQDGWFY